MSGVEQRVVEKLLLFYGTRCPDHYGKWRIHDALVRISGVHPYGDRVIERAGLKWLLDPSDYVQQTLYWLGVKDKWEIYHIQRLLQNVSRTAVILDCGANFGYYSLLLAKIFDCQFRIHSFEPCLEVFNRLSANIVLNDLSRCISAHRMGIGDKEGQGSMVSVDGNSGATYFSENGGSDSLISIDAFCQREKISDVAFIKLDVEGFEEKAILGARHTLTKARPLLLVELNSATLARQHTSANKVLQLLEGSGYSIWVCNRRKLVRMGTQVNLGDDYINVFCIPK